jgi:hypothetical protein
MFNFSLMLQVLCLFVTNSCFCAVFSLFCLHVDADNVKEPEGSLIDISSGPSRRKSKPVASPKSKPVVSPSVCPGGFATPQHSEEAAQSVAPAGKLMYFCSICFIFL